MSALTGLRVLEVVDISGAYCGKLLADMGADVIKIEPPEGDATRAIGPFYQVVEGRDRSLLFWHYGTNKRSVVLDIASARERDRLTPLLDTADVLITTGTLADCAQRGLDYSSLQRRHPRLVVTAISPFGHGGPRAEWKSCDTVAQALGGMLFVNGHPAEPPLRGLGLQAYHSASAYGAIGTLLALLARERSGRGQLVDISLQECVAATVEHASGMLQQAGEIEVRRGTLHWSRYFRVGKGRDGYLLHCSLGDWTSLIEWVKGDGKAQDLDGPEWEHVEHRRTHCEHLFDVLDEWIKDYRVEEVVEGAQLRRVPYAAVHSLESVAAHPQLHERGFFVPVLHDEVGRTLTYPGAPYQFGRTPWRIARCAPLLGEHTDPVLSHPPGKTGGTRVPSALGLDTQTALRGKEPSPTSAPASHAGEGNYGDGVARVLSGIRVLDFTWVVAGPVATRILADHGADIVKIERRDALDLGGRRGGLTGNLNRGKRSLVINMADPRGIALARELARCADVVIDNFSARVMRNWGLDYDTLRALKPDVIAISMSGLGATGPQKDYVSYGPTLQALAGYTLHMHHPGREPAGWGFSYSDMAGGYHAALAVLMALWHRRRTGEGQFVDLSQFESVVALLGTPLLELLLGGHATLPEGNRSPEAPAAPHGVYRCRDRPEDGLARDRWCAICVFTEDEWQRFVHAIGSPSWAAESRFRTLAARLAHRDELDALVEAWTREQTAEVAMETLQAAGVAAGLVANARDLVERDPHLAIRRYWARVPTPEGGVATFDGVPARLSETPGYVAAPGPLLGEHSDEILRELLGLKPVRIEQLRRDGVIS